MASSAEAAGIDGIQLFVLELEALLGNKIGEIEYFRKIMPDLVQGALELETFFRSIQPGRKFFITLSDMLGADPFPNRGRRLSTNRSHANNNDKIGNR
jgi:hypothetical protein